MENTEEEKKQPLPQVEPTVELATNDNEIAAEVNGMLANLSKGEINERVVTLLAQGLKHDEDVKNAETAGYIRGRNEKIDLMTRPDREVETTEPASFPRYRRRSVWDR